MKIIIYFISILLSVLGFYLDRIESQPAMLKIVDKEHYYIMQALDNFKNNPKAIIGINDPSATALLRRFWPNLPPETTVFAIGRTTMMQIMGDTSIGSDFQLVLNPERNALQDGISYTKTREKEMELFNKKFGNWGQWIFWIGILLGITDYLSAKIIKES